MAESGVPGQSPVASEPQGAVTLLVSFLTFLFLVASLLLVVRPGAPTSVLTYFYVHHSVHWLNFRAFLEIHREVNSLRRQLVGIRILKGLKRDNFEALWTDVNQLDKCSFHLHDPLEPTSGKKKNLDL